MDVIAHGGTLGLIVEIGPAAILLGIGAWSWLRDRRSAPDDEAAVQESGRHGE